MKNRIFFSLALLAALLLLAACGSAAPTPAPAEKQEQPAAAPTEEQKAEQPAAAPTEEQKAEQPAAAAEGYLAKIKERGKLVVGTSADYPPYESVDADGKFVGFDMELVQEIGKRMNVPVEIQDMAFDALIAAVEQGKIDAVVAAMQITPERLEKVDFSVVYHDVTDAFLVAKDSTIEMKSPKDAAGHTIGVQTGTTHEQWVVENLIKPGLMKEDQLSRYERADQGALDVAAGRIDMLFINADPAAELANKSGLKIALVTAETAAGGQAIAMPKGSADFKAEVDKIIGEMKDDGFIAELQKKYNIP